MKKQIRTLVVEDNENDWWLLHRELEKAGYDVFFRRVQTAEAMREALNAPWDIVLSDFSMPNFSATAALRVLQETGQDLPFIISSGTIGEETAVAALKAGAHDFLLKGQLARFVPAVERELREAELRRERRKIESDLSQSEARYRRIVETTQEGIWTLDAEGHTTYVNRRMGELLGSSPEKLSGSKLADFAESADILLNPASSGRARLEEVEFLRVDGSGFWASVSTTPILADSGSRMGTLVMVNDVSERRRLTEQLMVSDRLASVGTLAAGVAHEINNPLVVILANVNMAAQSLKELHTTWATHPETESERKLAQDLKELSEELSDVAEAGDRVRDIVKDLKIFSRGNDQATGPVSIQRVVESALRLTKNEIRHRAGVVIDLPDLPDVEANESRLGQVFVNLVINAAHAIRDGNAASNEIRISGHLEGRSRVVVVVSDTGAGMSAEVLRRLFTPFFTTKPIGVGTGLGLAICHRIIASFGGDIIASSELGRGSTFTIRLPVSALDSDAAVPARLESPPAQPPPGGRILIIDDERLIAVVLHRLLTPAYQVTSCTSARDAFERIRAGERYDVILCDLMMPQMTGAQFHAALKQINPAQAERVVFLTGGVFTQEMRDFVAGMGNDVVEKPFDPFRLANLLAERIRQTRDQSPGPAHRPEEGA